MQRERTRVNLMQFFILKDERQKYRYTIIYKNTIDGRSVE